MKFDNTYWHYRLVMRNFPHWRWRTRVSFCEYFWAVVWSCFLIFLGVVAVLAIATVATLALITGAAMASDYPVATLKVVALIGGLGGLVWGLTRAVQKYEDYKFSRPATYREPGLVKLRYRAWKDKVCPLVELDTKVSYFD